VSVVGPSIVGTIELDDVVIFGSTISELEMSLSSPIEISSESQG